ncbi:MAG TPA: glycosyltransferase [Flavobacterium sp.]
MTADTVGGVWTYAVDLCRALQSHQVHVHLATMGAPLSDDQKQQVQQLPNVFVYESRYKLEWMQDPWEDIAAAKEWLKQIFMKVNPDLVHFNNFGQCDADWKCPVVTVFHSCVQTWFRAVKKSDAPSEWNGYTSIVKNALNSSDIIIAPSKSIAIEAAEIYQCGNFQVIYNGSDKVSNAPHKQPYILAAGRIWDEAKNIALLTKIADKLSWPVYVAGDNVAPHTPDAADMAKVYFLGKLPADELQHYMSDAAIFVSPTKYEPFGLAILEAANAGCALALADIPTLREIWGDSAVYFSPEDEAEALLTLQYLIDNPESRTELAHRSSARAKTYNTSEMANAYKELYTKIVAQKLKPTI